MSQLKGCGGGIMDGHPILRSGSPPRGLAVDADEQHQDWAARMADGSQALSSACIQTLVAAHICPLASGTITSTVPHPVSVATPAHTAAAQAVGAVRTEVGVV